MGLKELTWPGLWDPMLSVLCPGCLPSHSCSRTSSPSSCWGKQSLLPPASGRWRGSRLCSMKALWELGLLLALGMQGFFLLAPAEVGGEAQPPVLGTACSPAGFSSHQRDPGHPCPGNGSSWGAVHCCYPHPLRRYKGRRSGPSPPLQAEFWGLSH